MSYAQAYKFSIILASGLLTERDSRILVPDHYEVGELRRIAKTRVQSIPAVIIYLPGMMVCTLTLFFQHLRLDRSSNAL